MKRILSAVLILVFGISFFTSCKKAERTPTMYTATFLTVFDTVTTIKGPADSEEAFQPIAQAIYDELLFYHQLFDIYNDYDGTVNLRTVNERAAEAPVKVDPALMALLQDCKDYYTLTCGKVNSAMGSVLSIWHSYREEGIQDPVNARLPELNDLESAAEHISMDALVLDPEHSTVFFLDPELKLDVGAVAKGWAAQRAAEHAPPGLLISVGGNVCATGPKDTSGSPWVIGVQDPDGGDYLHTVYLSGGSMVTSGDYQRYYTVDGTVYHHIIDPETLFPATLWRSVTVICDDSGLADALSTALFLLPNDAGEELLRFCDAEAMWVAHDGSIIYSSGFSELIRT